MPVYPVVRLELRGDDGETRSGFLNGELVATGSVDDVRRSVLDAASSAAARRPGGAIRARLTGFGDSEWGVVTANSGLLAAPAAAPQKKTSLRRLMIVALVVLLAGGAGVGLVFAGRWAAHFRGSGPAPQVVYTPAPVQLPVVGPSGWSSVARWSITASTSSSASTVATTGDSVFTVGEDGSSVVAVAATSGVRRWSTPAGAAIVGGPVLVGPATLVIWTADQVLALAATSGSSQGSWPLSQDRSQVAPLGAGLVATELGQHAQVFAAGAGVQDRVVPAGSQPVGVTGRAELVAVGAGRAWLVASPSVAGNGDALAAPGGTQYVGPVGLVGDRVVVAFSGAASSSVVLRAFEVGTWSVLWTTAPVAGGRYLGPGTPSPLMSSPDGSWGTYGSALVDLRSGQTTPLPSDWTSTAVGRDVGFGVTSGSVLAVRPDGLTATPTAGGRSSGVSAVGPVAVTDAGWALVIAQDGSQRALYAEPPISEGG